MIHIAGHMYHTCAWFTEQACAASDNLCQQGVWMNGDPRGVVSDSL